MSCSWGPRLTPERQKDLKMDTRGSKTVPAGPKIQPSSNQPRHPDAKSAKNPASPHSTQISKNIEVRRCRVSVLNINYYYTLVVSSISNIMITY